MLRTSLVTALAVLSVGLGGCEGRTRAQAAETASALLGAAVTRDRVAFEATIDRSAVRDDLRRQMVELARAQGLEVEGGPSDLALDRMIGPDALRILDAGGRPLAEAPDPKALAAQMELVDKRRACLHDQPEAGRCLLTFARHDGDWRLVAMQAQDLTIRVTP
jgi:hypothetical protein